MPLADHEDADANGRRRAQAGRRSARRKFWIAAAFAAMVLTAGAIPAIAAATRTPVVYHACVTNKTGAIRIVSAMAKCRSGQHKISWNNRGPAGSRGAPGVVRGYASYTNSVELTGAACDGVCQVDSLNLPAGSSYIVNMSAYASDDIPTPSEVYCSFSDPNDGLIYSSAALLTDDGSGVGEGTISITAGTPGGGEMDLWCGAALQNADSWVDQVSMTAIPVSTLHKSGLLPASTAASGMRAPAPAWFIRGLPGSMRRKFATRAAG